MENKMNNIALKVKGILPEAKETITLLLERTDGAPLNYKAGQFLTLILPINGRELRRSYSFSSAPGLDPTASITIKRVINGEASRFLQDHLQVGDELQTLPPAGKFTLEDIRGPRLFFIAAGSGMVPVFSLLKTALSQDQAKQVTVLSQFRDEESILFKKSLEELETRYKPRFRWVNLLSGAVKKTPGTPGDVSGGSKRIGRLNNWLLEELLGELLLIESDGDKQDPYFFLCGPPAFMRMAQFTLRLMGIAGTQIKKENFTVEYVPPPPLLTDTSPKKITLHTANRSYQFEAAWPTTILQAGLDNHIPMPYSCRGGRCSTCVAKCLKGEVKMSINEVLTDKDLLTGLVLPCVGYAATDLELEF